MNDPNAIRIVYDSGLEHVHVIITEEQVRHALDRLVCDNDMIQKVTFTTICWETIRQ